MLDLLNQFCFAKELIIVSIKIADDGIGTENLLLQKRPPYNCATVNRRRKINLVGDVGFMVGNL